MGCKRTAYAVKETHLAKSETQTHTANVTQAQRIRVKGYMALVVGIYVLGTPYGHNRTGYIIYVGIAKISDLFTR